MHPVLYGINVSPPVRAVMMVMAALNITYDFEEVNIMKGEQFSPEFLKKNPAHTVPVLQDEGIYVANSHAIAMYLADKVGDNEWYPKDLPARAAIHQRLFFDDATLYAALKTLMHKAVCLESKTARPGVLISGAPKTTCLEIVQDPKKQNRGCLVFLNLLGKQECLLENLDEVFTVQSFLTPHSAPRVTAPVFAAGLPEVPSDKKKEVEGSLDILSQLIQENGWLVGKSHTIADICACATATTIMGLEPTLKVTEKMSQWLKNCEELPAYASANKPGLEAISNMFAMKKKANASQ